jgi:hypothetical protein
MGAILRAKVLNPPASGNGIAEPLHRGARNTACTVGICSALPLVGTAVYAPGMIVIFQRGVCTSVQPAAGVRRWSAAAFFLDLNAPLGRLPSGRNRVYVILDSQKNSSQSLFMTSQANCADRLTWTTRIWVKYLMFILGTGEFFFLRITTNVFSDSLN